MPIDGVVSDVEGSTPVKQRLHMTPLFSPDRAKVDRDNVPARRLNRIASHPIVHRSVSETLSSPRSFSQRMAAPTSRPLSPSSQGQRLAETPMARKGHRPTTASEASLLWSPVASRATESAIEKRLMRESSASVGRGPDANDDCTTAGSAAATALGPAALASTAVTYGPRRTLAAVGLL
jgi:hypothetical protein